MPKIKLPPVDELLNMKVNRGGEPPWVYLEREMVEMANKGIKPYNQKVGNWLVLMKDLKEFYKQERQKSFEKLKQAVGPSWFCMMSPGQIEALEAIPTALKFDLYYKTYAQSIILLERLCSTASFPPHMVTAAVSIAQEDPGIFIWTLFTLYFKQQPSVPLEKYNIVAKILMTALVYIDLDNLYNQMRTLTDQFINRPKPPPKKTRKDIAPDIPFGVYLSRMYTVPPWYIREKPKRPYLNYKVKYWTDEEYEDLSNETLTISIQTRRTELALAARVNEKRRTKYKFWQAPTGFRADEPGMAEFQKAMVMLKLKPKPAHIKSTRPDNISCHIGTVTYSGGSPCFLLHNFITAPSAFQIRNGGYVKVGDSYVILILGSIKFPPDPVAKCVDCHCMKKWDFTEIKEYMDTKARCLCSHNYDYHNKPKAKVQLPQFLRPPTRDLPNHFLDLALVFDLDEKNEFIKAAVERALNSESSESEETEGYVDPASLPTKVLVMSFLSDLMESPILIPHLPKAYLLTNVQAWVRQRVKGPIGPKLKKNLGHHADRAWVNLKCLDFRARSHNIPFTVEQLKHFSFNHREYLQELKEKELKAFVKANNRLRYLESELFWASLRPQDYANKDFIKTFCAYMPRIGHSTFYLEPYGSKRIRIAKTCPLKF